MFCDMPENSRSAVTEAVDQRPSIQLKMKALSGVSLSGIIQKTSVFFGSTTADIFGKFPRMADADHVRSTFSAPVGMTCVPSHIMKPCSDRKNTLLPDCAMLHGAMQPILAEISRSEERTSEL